jgi:hypothetical protein
LWVEEIVKKYLAGGISGAVGLIVMLNAGTAYAVNEYNGMTYAKAAETISNYGGTAVIATREGSYLPTEKCIVVGSRKQSSTTGGGKVLLDLNCNDTSALNGHPGNSVATPEGKKALQARETAKSLNDDYAAAQAAGKQSYCDTHQANCAGFCQNAGAGLCSPELMQALGL